MPLCLSALEDAWTGRDDVSRSTALVPHCQRCSVVCTHADPALTLPHRLRRPARDSCWQRDAEEEDPRALAPAFRAAGAPGRLQRPERAVPPLPAVAAQSATVHDALEHAPRNAPLRAERERRRLGQQRLRQQLLHVPWARVPVHPPAVRVRVRRVSSQQRLACVDRESTRPPCLLVPLSGLARASSRYAADFSTYNANPAGANYNTAAFIKDTIATSLSLPGAVRPAHRPAALQAQPAPPQAAPRAA